MQNAGVLKKELLEANLRLELLENGSPSTDQRMQMHNLIPVVAAPVPCIYRASSF